ncbi:hypothetical protein M513_11706 [Trichuris suis]|uniref:Uncharacterized protein n=1 Tax=Trichuris suis TaxID=68888 RepID=A0A085LR41_9BILA|nr:hypothetical protein M513_11706 [Trichuris suis]
MYSPRRAAWFPWIVLNSKVLKSCTPLAFATFEFYVQLCAESLKDAYCYFKAELNYQSAS